MWDLPGGLGGSTPPNEILTPPGFPEKNDWGGRLPTPPNEEIPQSNTLNLQNPHKSHAATVTVRFKFKRFALMIIRLDLHQDFMVMNTVAYAAKYPVTVGRPEWYLPGGLDPPWRNSDPPTLH